MLWIKFVRKIYGFPCRVDLCMSNLQHLIQCFTGMIDLGYEIGLNSDYEKFNNRARPRGPPRRRARVVHHICSIYF